MTRPKNYTTTGRLVSSDCQLQNLPCRTEFGRQLAKVFSPPSLSSADPTDLFGLGDPFDGIFGSTPKQKAK